MSAEELEERQRQYAASKALYHKMGKAAEGTPEGSAERRAYAIAKRRYHLDGAALLRARGFVK